MYKRQSSWAPILKRAEAARKILHAQPRKGDQEQRTREVDFWGRTMCVGRQATLRGKTLNLAGYPVNLGRKSVILRAAW